MLAAETDSQINSIYGVHNFSTYFNVFWNLFLLGSVPCELFLLQAFCVLLLVYVFNAVLLVHLIDAQSLKFSQVIVFKVAGRFMLAQQGRVGDWHLLSPTYDCL